ncbi:unnamed protein product [Peniophora sp. CBMAI 1063]|nr:unnamed protein product [Peniophora sp. CBMAI 1063]
MRAIVTKDVEKLSDLKQTLGKISETPHNRKRYLDEVRAIVAVKTQDLYLVSGRLKILSESDIHKRLRDKEPPPGQRGGTFVDEAVLRNIISNNTDAVGYILELESDHWEKAYFADILLFSMLEEQMEECSSQLAYASSMMSHIEPLTLNLY